MIWKQKLLTKLPEKKKDKLTAKGLMDASCPTPPPLHPDCAACGENAVHPTGILQFMDRNHKLKVVRPGGEDL